MTQKKAQEIPINQLEKDLNTFKEKFYKKKNIMDYGNFLVYHRIPNGLTTQLVEEATKLILTLKLFLRVKSIRDETGKFADTIIIEENTTTKC